MATCVVIFLLLHIYGFSAYENLSRRKGVSVSMSSTFGTYVGERTIDGNINQHHTNCSHTHPRYRGAEAWVKVDLGSQYSIKSIRIYYRNDQPTNRFKGFYMGVSNNTQTWTRCYEDKEEKLPPNIITLDCKHIAQIVRIGTKHWANKQRPMLEICELEIWGCGLNRYGIDCTTCDENCQECDVEFGCRKATSLHSVDSRKCSVGYYGSNCRNKCYWCEGECTKDGFCIKCKDGKWGYKQFCRYACSRNCVQCNIHNGTCTKCKAGWQGEKCQQVCASGRYGAKCELRCSSMCTDRQCHHITGHCNNCVTGRTGNYCNETCLPGFYGESCSTPCSYGCNGNECNPVNGACSRGCVDANLRNPLCSGCASGYYRRTSKEKIYRCVECGHCKYQIPCDGSTGKCNDGCEPGWRERLCKKKCQGGYFGGNCSSKCSANCKDGECQPESGRCDCKPGFTGYTCQDCISGFYKENAKCVECGQCKYEYCSTQSGECTGGCKPGWSGLKCNSQCGSGTYGEGCVSQCSPNCWYPGCDHVSGDCTYLWCKSGWKGRKCDNCISGFYMEIAKCVVCGHCKYGHCSTQSGECTGGCKPGWSGVKCNSRCGSGTYGEGCVSQCSPNCRDPGCDHVSGDCTRCKSGWKGRKCDQCDYKFYMSNGSCIPCSSTCSRQLCNNTNGWCTHGCDAGWSGQTCNKSCPFGSYGKDCNKRCTGNCLNNETCDRINGRCTNGCMSGYEGQFCDQKCRKGYFGEDCKSTCNPNCKDGACQPESGSCECKRGYTGHMCQDCTGGFYKDNSMCVACGYCKHEGLCNAQSGKCTGGCKPGWSGTKCKLHCSSGTYGEGCRSQCSPYCLYAGCDRISGDCKNGWCKSGWSGRKCDRCADRFYMSNGFCTSCSSKCNRKLCNNATGWCTEGCIAGWSGHTCNESCPFGSHGKDCSKRCIGKCVNNETCNTVNGLCTNGCMSGYKGQFCDQTCVPGRYGRSCASTCSGRCNNGASCDPKNGHCSGGCIHGWYEPLCLRACEDGTYGINCRMTCSANCINGSICLHTNGTCLQGCNFGFEGHDCKTISVPVSSSLSEGSSAAIGSAIGVVAMFLISIIIGIIIYRSRRAKTISKTEQSRLNSGVTGTVCYSKPDICTTTINNAATGSAGEDTNDVLYYNEINIAKDVLVTELMHVIKNMETDTSDGFEKEFKLLPFGERFDCSAAKLQENMLKNRFKTTFPYDHSRVVLRPNGPYSSDYINANYIEDMFGQRHYIACQGPRINTVLDHWRLIWQEKIGKIVMLTGLIENQRVKCEQYWPNKDSDMIHGQWIIKLTEEKKYANYVIRKLEVADQSTKEKRMITHFHYTQWPDHGTPDPAHLVEFYRNVVRVGTGNVPLLVHCSAGLGRTGTFIALDALSRYGTMNGKVNVPEYVKVMRKDRMNMVQNSDQYAFLYHALHESFSCGGHILTREEVTNSAEKGQTNTSYRVEFDKLKTLKPVYKERDFCAGRENRSLNFTQNVLPLDKYRVYLPITVLGKGDYYNAVVLPSFTRPSAIIAAQFPAAGNGVDLARLLVNMEVGLLISTSDLSNIKSISDWVNDKTGAIDLKNYRIKNDSCKMLSDEIRKTVLTVQELESDVTQKVQCLELMSWRMDKKTPPDSNCIVEVIRYIETQRLTLPDSCVTVMSKDGASGCGLICAMYNASQQLSMDDEVDLFSIVRQLQIRRPEMFSSYEEYDFLYKTLQKYLTSDNIYANA